MEDYPFDVIKSSRAYDPILSAPICPTTNNGWIYFAYICVIISLWLQRHAGLSRGAAYGIVKERYGEAFESLKDKFSKKYSYGLYVKRINSDIPVSHDEIFGFCFLSRIFDNGHSAGELKKFLDKKLWVYIDPDHKFGSFFSGLSLMAKRWQFRILYMPYAVSVLSFLFSSDYRADFSRRRFHDLHLALCLIYLVIEKGDKDDGGGGKCRYFLLKEIISLCGPVLPKGDMERIQDCFQQIDSKRKMVGDDFREWVSKEMSFDRSISELVPEGIF